MRGYHVIEVNLQVSTKNIYISILYMGELNNLHLFLQFKRILRSLVHDNMGLVLTNNTTNYAILQMGP